MSMLDLQCCILKMIQMILIYKTDADWQNLKTNLCLPKGKGAGKDKLGVWDQHIHTTICKI